MAGLGSAGLRRCHSARRSTWLLRPKSLHGLWPPRWPAFVIPTSSPPCNRLAQAGGASGTSVERPLSRVAYMLASQGWSGPRHHRRGLPGAGGGQCRRVSDIRQVRERPVLLSAACTPWASSARRHRRTVRMFSPMYQVGQFQGQLSPEQLIDRYDLTCRPVRDLLVEYLKRTPTRR